MPGLTREEIQERKEEAPVVSFPAPPKKNYAKKRSWEESFQALIKYKGEHGNCDVPLRYSEDKALGQWVSRMKNNRQELAAEQRRRLDDVGFDFRTQQERNEQAWNEKYERLKAYRRENGHCRVPQNYEEDPELSTWVNSQRTLQKKERLPAHRLRKLERIDFTWTQRDRRRDTSKEDETWMGMYEKLIEFQSAHGHLMVPHFWSENQRLGRWVSNQRRIYNVGELRSDREEMLNNIGFVWRIDSADPDASLSQREWEAMLNHLEAYKKEYGNVNVHRSFKKWGLGNWMSVQRAEARHGRLDPRRADKLRELGVCWGKDFDQRWMQGLESLLAFKAKYGHINISSASCGRFFSKHIELVNWVRNQRIFREQGTLLPERKEKLDSVGFLWRYNKDMAHPEESSSESEGEVKENPQSDHSEDEEDSSGETSPLPLYPVGTRFIKNFPGHGRFEGRIEGFDGELYLVRYQEELEERDLDELEILDTTNGGKASRPVGAGQQNHEQTAEKEGDRETVVPSADVLPRYPIGLEFVKHFEGHGSFEGRVTAFDGLHYKVMYPKDGDEEELSEWEFESSEDMEITQIPAAAGPARRDGQPSLSAELNTTRPSPSKPRGRVLEDEGAEKCEPMRKRRRPENGYFCDSEED